MKQKVNPTAKTYCYKSECNTIETGFHLEKYYVCTICHEEVTPGLHEQIIQRKEDGAEIDEDLLMGTDDGIFGI